MEVKTMWRKKYLKVLNSITIICVVIGCMINMMKFAGMAVFSFMRNTDSSSDDGVVIGGTTGAFDKIDAKLSFGTVKVEYGNEYSYSISGFNNDTTPECKIKNGKLEIKQKSGINFNIFKDKAVDGTVTVTIIKNAEPDMDISLDMGSFELNGITLGNLNVDADMGSVTLKNCNMKNVEVQADMGGITFNNCTFDTGDFDANMGGITLENCTFDNASCDADMGSIDVTGTYDYLTADCDMGSIKASNTNQNAKYDLDCDMGDVKLNGNNVGDKYKN